MPVSEPDLSQLRHLFNRLRAESGLTFEELAEASGVSRQTLLNLSSGKYHGDLRTRIRLSQVFGISLNAVVAATFAAATPSVVRNNTAHRAD